MHCKRWLATLMVALFGSAWSLAQVPQQPTVPAGGVVPVSTAPAPGFAPAAPPVTTQPAAQPAPQDPMDYPLRLVADAAAAFQNVRDYTCLFIRREQVNGQLQAESVMNMRVRQQPFSVYLRWLGPKDLAGQEVVYVAGRNGNNLRVHATGIRGTVGFISIAPNDPRAMAQSRHPITEAGIGNLIASLQRNWTQERGQGRTQVRVADFDYARRKCTRVELTHTNDAVARRFYAARSVIYFDKETRLPIRAEAYDWPRAGGPPEGDLLEVYSYVDLRFNVGVGEETFNR
jgi:hypothetical protein